MSYLAQYSLFFAKTLTLALAIIAVIAAIFSMANKSKGKYKLKVKKLNDHYNKMKNLLQFATLNKSELKAELKKEKKQKKLEKKEKDKHTKKRQIFVLDFHGDIKASAVNSLREEINAILTLATPKDEVLLRLESPGGVVHGYGLAASQLKRLRDKRIPLTVAIDKVAASGGYLMASVANRIIAAPFAIVGSIGVIAQLPNFNRFLKKKNIDFEQFMAGEYKRTVTIFGENTNKGRHKFQHDIEAIQTLFKKFVKENRDIVDIDKVATGEYWQASHALALRLVDELKTSDDYLLSASQKANIYHIQYHHRKKLPERLAQTTQLCFDKLLTMLSGYHHY